MSGLTKILIVMLLLLSMLLTVVACGPKEETPNHSGAADNGSEVGDGADSGTKEEGTGLSEGDNLDSTKYGPMVRV